MSKKISVIIITRDEEKMIEDCLKSINNWADEILVIDHASTDRTIDIAKKYRAIISSLPSKATFSQLRNKGLKEANGDWIFYLDADERATDNLKKEIGKVISSSPKFFTYVVPRRNFYLGREVRFGGAYPDYVKRLFKKDKLNGWKGDLHEEPIFEGQLGHLREPMIHITHRDLSSMVEKTKNWSTIEAQLLYDAKHPPVTWWRILKIMLTEFCQRGIKLQGWRDGTVGWIEIIFQMFSRFMTYARLWELQQIKKGK